MLYVFDRFTSAVLVIGFTIDTVSVTEEAETVELTLRSNIPLQDSGMNIVINTEDGTAVGTHNRPALVDIM